MPEVEHVEEYDSTQPSRYTLADCEEAVGKRASITLTGEIVAADESAAGPFVRFEIDKRWGFPDAKLGMDLDPFALESQPPAEGETEKRCPTCGSPVKAVTADEGTSYYVPAQHGSCVEEEADWPPVILNGYEAQEHRDDEGNMRPELMVAAQRYVPAQPSRSVLEEIAEWFDRRAEEQAANSDVWLETRAGELVYRNCARYVRYKAASLPAEPDLPELRAWLREEIADVLEIESTQGLSMWGEARKATLLKVRDLLPADQDQEGGR